MSFQMNYWKPAGNANVGDCMPFTKDGVFHLYYLLDVGHHNNPVVGWLGGHQVAHVSSTDLIHWEHHDLAMPCNLFDPARCSITTGSFLEYKGKVYAFYSIRSRNVAGEQFRIAVSEDGGMSFQEQEPPQMDIPPECGGQFRDSKAFIGEDGLIHLLISTGAVVPDKEYSASIGEVKHYTTSDLVHFKREAPWHRSWYAPECCDYFRMGSRYYFTYNLTWETHVRISDKPFGPWEIPAYDIPASRFCCVMKTAPWKNGRRIGAAWVPTWENAGPQFGGKAVFREIVQNEDGSLGTAFVEEMIPQDFKNTLPDVNLTGRDGLNLKYIGKFPSFFRLDGTIEFSGKTGDFGIAVKNREQDCWRYVSFEPATESVKLCTAEIRKTNLESGKVSFRLIRSEDILDLEVNGNRTVIAPSHDFPDSYVIFFVRDTKAEFRDLKLYY